MPLLVMKFGGTSVADLARIKNAAQKVKREVERGYDVIVIVSAMSGKTNELVGWVEQTSPLFDAREYDAVVSSGENVTAGLMALTLQEMEVPARSWQGLAGADQDHLAAFGRALPRDPARKSRREIRRRLQGRGGRGLPGREPRGADHDAGPRRLGHDGRGLCRRFRRRALRHLYRRGRGLYDRSADRVQGAQAGKDRLRGDAGARLARREGAADPLGRAGDALQGEATGAVLVRGHGRDLGNPGLRRGRISWNRKSSLASPIRATKRK